MIDMTFVQRLKQILDNYMGDLKLLYDIRELLEEFGLNEETKTGAIPE